jgi:hypothetical protein
MRALPAHRETTTMTKATVAADVHQTLDVHLDTLAKVAFDLALRIEDGADAPKLIFGQISYASISANLRFLQDRGRTRASNAVNVCQTDLRTLMRRKINTSYTSHLILFSD